MQDQELLNKIQERQLRCQERDKQQTAIDTLSLEIQTELALRNIRSVGLGEWQAAQVDGVREAISKGKLEQYLLEKVKLSVDDVKVLVGACCTRSAFTSLRVTRRSQ